MERSEASLMPPPPPMPPARLSCSEVDPASASVKSASSDGPHTPSEAEASQSTRIEQVVSTVCSPMERSKASLMLPPPPMAPPRASERPASLEANPALTSINSSSSDDRPAPSQTGATQSTQVEQVDPQASEKRDDTLHSSKENDTLHSSKEKETRNNGARVQSCFSSSIYTIPSWSAAPAFPFTLEVVKDGALVDTLNVSEKGAYMFGRSDQCDFMMEHPSISRFHAVLQFKRNGEAFLYDLGSTHGTVVNKKQIAGRTYVPLHVGHVFKFGLSSRLYLLQGPEELMPKEGLTKAERQILKESQGLFDTSDREASLLRAKRDVEGATWGMMEDAVEGDVQEEEEVTWQTYKGQLTEKQQKTLEKIHKRNEKVASLKREIDAIQVKEIPQGGLTQGQQTQVARNQQRIEQLMEELDNLEETLNQSIQESIGARAKKGSGRKGFEDEEEVLSDDDDFYDRTILIKNSKAKGSEPAQIIETAESLLEKRAKALKELEGLNQLLELEGKNDAETSQVSESQDALDAFMTTVSSKLESDRASNLRQEIEKQQADLNRIAFLLKFADPTGEAQKNWKEPQFINSEKDKLKQTNQKTTKKDSDSKMTKDASQGVTGTENIKVVETLTAPAQVVEQQGKPKVEGPKGPLRLGLARKQDARKATTTDSTEDTSTNDQEFIEYKERHKSALNTEEQGTLSEIPQDACGLILRKPKDVGEAVTPEEDAVKKLWEGAALAAADDVALLLRHQRGLGALVDEGMEEESFVTTIEEVPRGPKKRKLGPERPEFLSREEGKFQAWVPPEGQTGDGKTALNKKYGY